jgi:DNA cross-link repair 1C protein
LAGLESFKSPLYDSYALTFSRANHVDSIFCSPATKELLLRLERYPHRLNFELGILESRKQTYKHLQKLLKPVPLETPTRIELQPGKDIQVTLFDANHCTGAVMFCLYILPRFCGQIIDVIPVFEGDGKAVLYTGDIRSEPWFVNSLTRNPFLIEYTSDLKTLDCIYLDTSNTSPIEFPTKADGIKELLQKVSKYPQDTVFHFAAWTFGYEEVWMALSKALQSPVYPLCRILRPTLIVQ